MAAVPYLVSGIAMPPANSRISQTRFASASVTSARSGAGDEQAQAAEGDRAEHDQHERDERVAVRVPGQREAGGADQHDLHDLEQQGRQRLAAEQHRAGQRRGAQALEHGVLALEPGADGEPGERGGHDGQRHDARHHEVDAARRVERVQQRQVEEEQQQQRDQQREADLLAVAQQQAELHRRLGARASARAARRRAAAGTTAPCSFGVPGDSWSAGGANRWGDHALSSRPVSSRKTSSSVRRSTARFSASTCCPAHHAVRVARNWGVTSPVTR